MHPHDNIRVGAMTFG
ncbi:DUF1317 family protein, partial [Escherichia coli]